MNFIIGGAYQGKLDCAEKQFSITDDEVFTCTEDGGIRFGSRCINKLEEFTLWCVRNNADAIEILREHRDEWRDSVLICCDIFCGVVPMGADMRAWRDMTGKLCAYLSAEAETVIRMFCGLPQRLK
ncbi:MAG: bifunctional adenosylcobinamide kinase/adenosylcobinamide-phosphate guanylyltransferase [Eubacteriales bacterium]